MICGRLSDEFPLLHHAAAFAQVDRTDSMAYLMAVLFCRFSIQSPAFAAACAEADKNDSLACLMAAPLARSSSLKSFFATSASARAAFASSRAKGGERSKAKRAPGNIVPQMFKRRPAVAQPQ